jgi:hypothetical protein
MNFIELKKSLETNGVILKKANSNLKFTGKKIAENVVVDGATVMPLDFTDPDTNKVTSRSIVIPESEWRIPIRGNVVKPSYTLGLFVALHTFGKLADGSPALVEGKEYCYAF